MTFRGVSSMTIDVFFLKGLSIDHLIAKFLIDLVHSLCVEVDIEALATLTGGSRELVLRVSRELDAHTGVPIVIGVE